MTAAHRLPGVLIKARVQEIHLELLNLVGHSPEVAARRAKLRQEMLEIKTQIEKMTKATDDRIKQIVS